MSSPAPKQITITTAAANPSHPSHWQTILAYIMAVLNAVDPIIITLVPPPVAVGLEVASAVGPIVIQAGNAIQGQ